MRKPLIAGNWKMHKPLSEAVGTARALVECLKGRAPSVDIMIAPPFTALAAVNEVLSGSSVALGAQHVFWEPKGAFTGEVSVDMLVSVGCRYVIIGHSERRQFFGETDDTVNRRLRAAFSAGLIPVVCVGETEAERDTGKMFEVLDKQIRNGLKGLASDDLGRLVVAYEPVWAIGTGRTATSAQAQEVHAVIRSNLAELFDPSLANETRILYGGSVKPDNIAELMRMPDVDGALVGGASLEAETFAAIIYHSGERG